MSFSKQLTAFVSGTKEKIDKTVRGATVTLATNVITETPVDEGTARGNWQTSIGEPKTGILDRKGSEASITELEATVPDEAGQVVFISNNLPYIRKLEYGYSEQARNPDGMVRVNAAKWPQVVEHEAAKHK